MERKELINWLETEQKRGNSMAEMFVALLKDAAPDVKEHWYNQLEIALGGAMVIVEQIKKEAGGQE